METFENIVAACCVAQFLWSYYRNCYCKGYRMDVWHFTQMWNVLAIHVLLPFDRSDLNVFALGIGLLRRTQEHVTQSYAITTVGYLGILAGGQLWRFRSGMGLRHVFSQLVMLPARASRALLDSRLLLRVHAIVAGSAMGAIILIYFRIMGFGMDAGSVLIANHGIRPFGQFALFYGGLISSYTLIRSIRFREVDMIVATAALFVELAFYGSRSSILSMSMIAILVGCIRLGPRLKLWWILGGGFGGVFLAMVLDELRRPTFSLQRLFAGLTLNIFYGNSFSDVRDFAVILSFWDGNYFWGKTYLAALFAFVPQVISKFRSEWSLGVVTATMAGFTSTTHPGMRIGISGEAFLNFGIPGVILVGVFTGAVLRLVDVETKRAILLLPTRNLRVYSMWATLLIVGVVQNSSTASTFYTTMLILWVSQVLVRILGNGRVATVASRPIEGTVGG